VQVLFVFPASAVNKADFMYYILMAVNQVQKLFFFQVNIRN